MKPLLLAAALVGTGLSAHAQPPAPAAPAERYYMTLFGAQSVPILGRYTHTWAAFVRTRTTAQGETPVAVDTISWMPEALKIRPLVMKAEAGKNLTMDETFQWIATFDGRVSRWGPNEIDAERYGEIMKRKAELESGTVKYRAIGGLTKRGDIVNCGQSFARSNRNIGDRYLYPTPTPGENGTGELAERYLKAGVLLNDGATHEWLLPVIGADKYPSTARLPGENAPRFRR